MFASGSQGLPESGKAAPRSFLAEVDVALNYISTTKTALYRTSFPVDRTKFSVGTLLNRVTHTLNNNASLVLQWHLFDLVVSTPRFLCQNAQTQDWMGRRDQARRLWKEIYQRAAGKEDPGSSKARLRRAYPRLQRESSAAQSTHRDPSG